MHRSKLESYEAILRALTKRPLSIDHLAYKTGMHCSVLIGHLTFLMANGVVEERNLAGNALLAITRKGVTVFRTLDFQKCLRKLSEAFMAIEGARHDVPVVLKRKQRPP